MLLLLTALSFGVFIGYLIFALTRLMIVPRSLSDTYYMLGRQGKLFVLALPLMALLILPGIIGVTPDDWTIIAFLCPAAIAFVGVAAEFKITLALRVHETAAITAATMGVAWTMLFSGSWWVVPVVLAVMAILGIRTRSLLPCIIFWLEMAAFFSVYVSLFLALI